MFDYTSGLRESHDSDGMPCILEIKMAGSDLMGTKRQRQKVACQCGCGEFGYYNQLEEVKIEQASDHARRQTKLTKRFFVLRKCKPLFEDELRLIKALQILNYIWVPKPKTFHQKCNVALTLYNWCRRMGMARQVMRMVHAIDERTKGFDAAHDHAMRSSILFGAPRFLQGFLARRFLLRAKRKEAKDATRANNARLAKA